MKKEFIKKLSIAMTSAMLVTTMAVPAVTTADAATKMKMNKSSKVLYLNSDNMSGTSDTVDLSIKNKPTSYKTKYSFNWYADDTTIVSVAKGGVVTAKKVGQTTVNCEITKKSTGKVVTTATCVVTVKANAETVTIKNAPEDNEMTVGSTFDFNRTMKSAAGTKATDKTEWVVSDTEVATIDKNGVVTALKAGTFTVTAKTYQSAKYSDTYTAESEAVTITVVPSVTAVTQTAYNKVVLTCDTDMSETLTTSNVVIKNASGVLQTVKSVAFSADGKTATVTLYTSLTDGVTYTVAAGDLETQSFVASVGEVASIAITSGGYCADNEAFDLETTCYDANGIVVPAATDSSMSYEITSSNTTDGYIYDDQITMYTIGKVVTIQGTYHTGNYDTSTGVEDTFTSPEITMTCVDTVDATVSSITATTISETPKGSAVDWTGTLTNSISLSDTSSYVNIKYVNSDDDVAYTDATASTDGTDVDGWTFTSSNTSVITVDEETGALYPVATGTATIICTFGNSSYPITVTVSGYRTASSITLSADSFKLSNVEGLADSKTVTVVVYDQFGDIYDEDTAPTITAVTNTYTSALTYTTTDGKVTFNVVEGGSTGTYKFKVTSNDLTRVVTITVGKQGTSTVSYGAVSVSSASVDTVITSKTTATTISGKAIDVSVSKYTTSGVKCENFTDSDEIKYVVKNASGYIVYSELTSTYPVKSSYYDYSDHFVKNTDGTLTVNTEYVYDSNTVDKLTTGTYTVYAYALLDGTSSSTESNYVNYFVESGSTTKHSIQTTSFVVKDTQTTPTVAVNDIEIGGDSTIYTGTTLTEALVDCLEPSNGTLTLNTVTSSSAGWDSDSLSFSTTGTKSVVVKYVDITEEIGNYTVVTTITLNRAITVVVE